MRHETKSVTYITGDQNVEEIRLEGIFEEIMNNCKTDKMHQITDSRSSITCMQDTPKDN
jgi:uncharacterized protein YutD